MEIKFTKIATDEDIQNVKRGIELAGNGNKEAQAIMGCVFRYGKEVEHDDIAAFKFYSLAAENGDPEAQFELGSMYFIGEGVEKNPERGLYWERRAAESGWVDAQKDLGFRYVLAKDVPLDETEGMLWIEKAGAQGNYSALTVIAAEKMRRAGECKDLRYGNMLQWMEWAAEKDELSFGGIVGGYYERGWGADIDLAKALHWYQRMQERGSDYSEPIARVKQKMQDADNAIAVAPLAV